MKEIRNLINITDLTVEELDQMMELAEDIIENPLDYQDICHGKEVGNPLL